MSHEVLIKNKVMLCPGDSRHFLNDEMENRYDSVVCDPPYALGSIAKRFGSDNAAPAKGNDAYIRASKGFMGKKWDTGDSAHSVEFWREVLRVMKPGAHLVAFGGTRTYHRLACSIEDAGFEIRDQIGWCFGSGFPKSHNIGDGWGTALKPAWEPICLARKPLSEKTIAENMWRWRTGAINVDGCRVPLDNSEGAAERAGEPTQNARYTDEGSTNFAAKPGRRIGSPTWGGPMKRLSAVPGQEGKLVERTPPNNSGRWPANIVHDGSEEVIAAFPSEAGAFAPIRGTEPSVPAKGDVAYGFRDRVSATHHGDSGSAARFFYQAKADKDDRLGSKHPTVKPVDLMQWLVRLVTPKGGLVLDPFAGTGTTAEACVREGMRCMLVEREAEYQDDIRRRMRLLMSGPEERKREAAKARAKGQKEDHGPLFGEPASEDGEKINTPAAALAPPGPDAVSLLAKLRRGAGRAGPIPKLTAEVIEE